jgi:hypothetical protein
MKQGWEKSSAQQDKLNRAIDKEIEFAKEDALESVTTTGPIVDGIRVYRRPGGFDQKRG